MGDLPVIHGWNAANHFTKFLDIATIQIGIYIFGCLQMIFRIGPF